MQFIRGVVAFAAAAARDVEILSGAGVGAVLDRADLADGVAADERLRVRLPDVVEAAGPPAQPHPTLELVAETDVEYKNFAQQEFPANKYATDKNLLLK